MATTNKRLCKGTLADSNATLYTAPSSGGNYAVVKALTLCNIGSAAVTVTLKLASTEILCQYSILGYDTVTIPYIDQILQAGELIEGMASVTSVINYYISGKEVT